MAHPSFYTSPAYARYLAHLHSDFWYSLKEERLRLCGRKCERCGKSADEAGVSCLEAHHARPYRDCLFKETVSDIRILCPKCHSTESGTTRTRVELTATEHLGVDFTWSF